MVLSPTELGSISLPYKGILGGSFYNSIALFRSHKLEGNVLEGFSGLDFVLSLQKHGFDPWSRELRSWQTAWSGQNKSHKL